MSVSSSTKIANDFSESFKIIDVVVYVVTVMAAALAFAVVFTLSNTNISERERELATIKVLGFRRREVYRYINKETIVLTLIGIVAGWPLGYLITRFLTYVLRMPSLFFDTIVEPPDVCVRLDHGARVHAHHQPDDQSQPRQDRYGGSPSRAPSSCT